MKLLNKVPSFQRQQSIFKVFMIHLPHLLDFCTKRGFVLQVSALAGKGQDELILKVTLRQTEKMISC